MSRYAVNDIVRMREALERSRTGGADFDVAWRAAVKHVKDHNTRHALAGTKWVWAVCFEGRVPATSGERAAARLADCFTSGPSE